MGGGGKAVALHPRRLADTPIGQVGSVAQAGCPVKLYVKYSNSRLFQGLAGRGRQGPHGMPWCVHGAAIDQPL